MTTYSDLIAAQRDLQLRLGNDIAGMTIDERIEFIRMNVLACTDELHEALGEVGWKSWASSRHINEMSFFGELRDAWQFLTNMMLIVEPDPERLSELFVTSLMQKLKVNHARVGSYDGITTKCVGCSRALEDVTITEIRTASDLVEYRCMCGALLASDIVEGLLD